MLTQELTGRTACQGQGEVQGIARVLRNVADIERLQPEDILICEMTTPEWTMAFGKVRGIVTRVGGALCHAAIVAREFGLPCIVSVEGALDIPDGHIVTLNTRGRGGTVNVGEMAKVKKTRAKKVKA